MTRLTTIDSHLSHKSYWSPSFKSTEEQIVMEVFCCCCCLDFFCLCFVWWQYSTVLRAYSGNVQWILLGLLREPCAARVCLDLMARKASFTCHIISVPVLEFFNIRSSLIPIAFLSHIRTSASFISNFVPKFVFLLFWPMFCLLLLDCDYWKFISDNRKICFHCLSNKR